MNKSIFVGLLAVLCAQSAFAQRKPGEFIPGTGMVVSNTVDGVKKLLVNLGLSSLEQTIKQLEEDLEPLIGYTCFLNKLDYTVDQTGMLKVDKALEGVGLALQCIPGDKKTDSFTDIIAAIKPGSNITLPTGVKGCKITISKANTTVVKTVAKKVISQCGTCIQPGQTTNAKADALGGLIDQVLAALGLGSKPGGGKGPLDGLLGGLKLDGILGGLGRKMLQANSGLADLIKSLGGEAGSKGLIDSLVGPEGVVGKLLKSLLGPKGLTGKDSKTGKFITTTDLDKIAGISYTIKCEKVKQQKKVIKVATTTAVQLAGQEFCYVAPGGGKVTFVIVQGDKSTSTQLASQNFVSILSPSDCLCC